MSQLPATSVNPEENLQQMPVMQHLIVLRQYLFKIVGVTIFLFFCLLPFRNQTYTTTASCILNHDCNGCYRNLHGTVQIKFVCRIYVSNALHHLSDLVIYKTRAL